MGLSPRSSTAWSLSWNASWSRCWPFDAVIMHNLFSKHFNLPLTAALNNLISRGVIKRPIQWIHDLSWTSQHSLGQMHEGYPWDLLRTMQPRSIYITISEARRNEIVSLFGCSPSAIKIIYDGVAPEDILGLSPTGSRLIRDLGVWSADLVLLMPVRVTQAKNIEYAIRLAAALKEADIQPRSSPARLTRTTPKSGSTTRACWTCAASWGRADSAVYEMGG